MLLLTTAAKSRTTTPVAGSSWRATAFIAYYPGDVPPGGFIECQADERIGSDGRAPARWGVGGRSPILPVAPISRAAQTEAVAAGDGSESLLGSQ